MFQDWVNEKVGRDVSHQYVWNKGQFDAIDSSATDYILGIH